MKIWNTNDPFSINKKQHLWVECCVCKRRFLIVPSELRTFCCCLTCDRIVMVWCYRLITLVA